MSMGPGRFGVAGGLLALLSACGSATPRAATSTDDQSAAKADDGRPEPCAAERQRSAELTSAAEAIAAPQVPKHDNKDESLAFLRGPFADWVRSRRAATDSADQALTAALACMPHERRAGLLLQQGRLQSHFVVEFLRTAETALPTAFASDSELRRALLDGLAEAVQPQVDRARSAFEQCVASGGPPKSPEASTCSQELAQLPQPTVPPASKPPSSSSGELKPPPRLEYTRPFIDTKQATPCTFAGTLKLWRPVLSVGSRQAARLEEAELSRVTLPPTRGGAFVIETTWPIRGSFTLPASAAPFNLRSRVDLVKQHVWLSAAAAVSAAKPTGGRALAYRPLAENRPATPDPAVTVACSELELAGKVEPKDDTKRDYVNFKGTLELAEAPAGSAIGSMTLSEPEAFTLLGRRDGWLHIQSLATPFRGFGQLVPYDFDAWTKTTPTQETSWGMIGLLNQPTPPTHTSLTEVPLYAEPTASETVGKLAKGVPLLIRGTHGTFVNIVIPGLDAVSSEQSGFWADQNTLERSVHAL